MYKSVSIYMVESQRYRYRERGIKSVDILSFKMKVILTNRIFHIFINRQIHISSFVTSK